MQLNSIYLYPNKITAYSNDLAGSWITERYRQVYQRNLKIYRGVDNNIDLQIKTSDQKPQNVTGYDFVFVLVNSETQELILQKDFVARALNVGKITLTLTQSELIGIEPGLYQYSIIRESRTGDSTDYVVTERTVLYMDSQYGTKGTLEIYGDIKGEPTASLVIKEFREDVPEVFTDPRIFYSSIIDANPQLSTGSSVHTFQFYLENYTGTVVIQGSLSQGANPWVWTDIETYSVVDSDLTYSNITGKYNYFRIKHTPDSGTIDKILYR
jgi:hypothetical protein